MKKEGIQTRRRKSKKSKSPKKLEDLGQTFDGEKSKEKTVSFFFQYEISNNRNMTVYLFSYRKNNQDRINQI